MLLDRVSNPGPLTYESGALPTALRSPAHNRSNTFQDFADVSRLLYCCFTSTVNI